MFIRIHLTAELLLRCSKLSAQTFDRPLVLPSASGPGWKGVTS